uniref:SAP domain-containing protein n=1 Tax=Nucleocytoviricota sp. TaxID=2809609 RepID=A0A9E8GAU8_9VIRU|nr:hypothetical protein [Nucleocytoviricota sp.]UZT29108.1 hypothetical protein [Nucleocytoviricota sp.]
MNIYELINNEKNLENINKKNNNNLSNDDICLISNKPLIDNYIVLDCQHKFNYEDLYNEYKYQKNNKNYYDTSRPLPHQIKCPYCRSFTDKVLPYFKALLPNHCCQINLNKNFEAIKLYECTYIYKNSTENCKMNCCNTEFGKLCNKHYTLKKNANNRKLLKEKNKQNNYSKNNSNVNNSNKNNTDLNNFDHLIPEYDVDSIIYLHYKLHTNQFNRLTIPQLKLLLKINNCKVSGNKTQLVERVILKKNECVEKNIIWNNTIYKAIEE